MAANHDRSGMAPVVELSQVDPPAHSTQADADGVEAYRHPLYQPFADSDELMLEDGQANRRFSHTSAYFSYQREQRLR